MRTLITGGVKSGKSRYALQIACEGFGTPRRFLATAEAFDDEMRARIEAHQQHRGDGFETIEEPLYIDRYAGTDLVLDCITIWMNNIVYYEKLDAWEAILDRFLAHLGANAVIVTNETGLGNIPTDAYTRNYNRLLGEANFRIASVVDRVVLMVSGLPVTVK